MHLGTVLSADCRTCLPQGSGRTPITQLSGVDGDLAGKPAYLRDSLVSRDRREHGKQIRLPKKGTLDVLLFAIFMLLFPYIYLNFLVDIVCSIVYVR